MKIHKETIASELQLLIDGVNSKEQAVEEISAYIRWRDKQLTIPDVVGRSEQLFCDCKNPDYRWIGDEDDMYEECFNCRKDKAK